MVASAARWKIIFLFFSATIKSYKPGEGIEWDEQNRMR